jgi:hypothetical protein
VRIGRRHHSPRIARLDARHQRARRCVAGDNDPAGEHARLVVETEVPLPLRRIDAVAVQAVVGEDRPNDAVEARRLALGRDPQDSSRSAKRSAHKEDACKACRHAAHLAMDRAIFQPPIDSVPR